MFSLRMSEYLLLALRCVSGKQGRGWVLLSYHTPISLSPLSAQNLYSLKKGITVRRLHRDPPVMMRRLQARVLVPASLSRVSGQRATYHTYQTLGELLGWGFPCHRAFLVSTQRTPPETTCQTKWITHPFSLISSLVRSRLRNLWYGRSSIDWNLHSV